MKKEIKLLSLLMAISCAASLSSCGNKQKGYDAATDTWTFTVWTNDSHSKATMERLVNEYNEGEGKKKGIKIDYQIQSSGEAVSMSLESDDAPDFFSDSIKEGAERGRIAAIEDMPGGDEYLKQYEGNLVEGVHKYNGKTYKVPYYVTTFGLVYNKDMFKKYGLVDENGEAKPPKTFDEVREYAKLLTNPKSQEYGIVLPLKNEWFTLTDIQFPMMTSRGYIDFDPETGKVDYTGYKPIIDMYMGIKEDKSYYPDPEGLDNDSGRAQFAEGNVGMKFAGSYDVGVFNDQFPAKCDWGVAPFPVEDDSTRYMSRMASDGYLCINAKSAEEKDKKKLFEVYKWLHGKEVLKALYEDGKAIPYDWNIVADVDLGEDAPTGWEDFCELVKVSHTQWRRPGTIMTGQKNLSQMFIEDIWPGNVDVKEALEDLTERSQKGMEEWLKENPAYKLEDYMEQNVLVPIED